MENKLEGNKQMNVLVTGGAGFIGTNLIEEIIERWTQCS